MSRKARVIILATIITFISRLILAVPVRIKIAGIVLLPILILGFSLNYWVTKGLSDWLSYILTDHRVEAAMDVGSRSVLFVTLLAAFASVFFSALLTMLLTHPLIKLQKTAELVASGQFETRAEVWADDEIGALARSINAMIDQFDHYQTKLAATNKQLQIINDIAMASDRGLEIHDVLYIALEEILKLLRLKTAWIYLIDPEYNRIHLASWYGVPEAWQAKLLDFERPRCFCQTKISSDDANIRCRTTDCKRLSEAFCPETSLKHLSIPIVAQDNCFGVINILLEEDHPLKQTGIESLTSLVQQLSEIVANAWLRMKLRDKEEARQLLLQSLVKAQEEERTYLARELHDQSGQSMTSLLIRLKTLQRGCQDEALEKQLTELQNLVEHTVDELRELSYRLHPPALEELGLVPALRGLLDEMSAEQDFKVTFDATVTRINMPKELQLVFYRIAQEALTNVVRHSQAKQVEVSILVASGTCMMEIKDDGVGFVAGQRHRETRERHLGLINMTERAELVGGKLEIVSAPQEGTQLRLSVPVAKRNDQ